MRAWDELFAMARPAFAQHRTFERARGLAACGLACLGRHTVSGLLCTAGQQFVDWSGAYRLFEQERLDLDALWRVPLHNVLTELPASTPVVALIDDTLVRKRGQHISGTSWRRDPLGPHFADNFIWASRFLQISLALPATSGATASGARAIPVDLVHAPSPRKPSRRATAEQWQAWRAASANSAISAKGAQRIQALRQLINEEAGRERQLLVCADATFTNSTVLKALPPHTVLIGRMRKDARLFALPTTEQENHGRGRHRCYGDPWPTPEQYRQNQSLGWKRIRAFAAGSTHTFHVKVVSPVRWKHAGGDRQLQLLIVRAVPYRLRKWGRLSYRKPAYLICTDPSLSPQQILQAYLWRWEIEVNFRDEKTLLGLGQPQVRTEPAVRTTASFAVFIYALLLLALHRCRLANSPLPPPRWQRPNPKRPVTRITTQQAIALFRAELWASALGLANKNGFVATFTPATKPLKLFNGLQSALLYASG